MNFIKFLENRFQELRLKEGTLEVNAFDIGLDSEIKAIHHILTTFRSLYKWATMPKVIFHYFLVLLHLARRPEPALLNKLKEQKAAEEAKKAADATLGVAAPKDPSSESDVVH